MHLYLPLITNGLLCPATSNNPALELKRVSSHQVSHIIRHEQVHFCRIQRNEIQITILGHPTEIFPQVEFRDCYLHWWT